MNLNKDDVLELIDDKLGVTEETKKVLKETAFQEDALEATQQTIKELKDKKKEVKKSQEDLGYNILKQITKEKTMATPMEYDTLREIYSSAMAALTRLETQQDIDTAQFKEAENNFVQVWLNEVKRKDLKEIDYQVAAQKMKDAAKLWTTIEDEFYK